MAAKQSGCWEKPAKNQRVAAARVLSERLACPILPSAIERFGHRVILGDTGTDASILTGYIIITLSWDLS